MLDRQSAERYAGWFKALADPTRVQLVTLLAQRRRPMAVGEIVALSGVGQSTVSHHLKALAEVRFVLSERRGTTRWYRINEACVSCFPSAADIVMGREVPAVPACAVAPDEAAAADIRERVGRRYAAAANGFAAGRFDESRVAEGSCCGSAMVTTTDQQGRVVLGGELYCPEITRGLPSAAVAASLGCGVPTAVADLHPGETVLDLGSGAGADVLIAAHRVAPGGRAIGLDMTTEMLDLARANAADAGVTNVEFLRGYLEDIPLPDASIDVVISNCVINLAADKDVVLREAARVLRPGGRLAISDVVADPDLDDAIRKDVAQWTGCIAGALTKAQYRAALARAGLLVVEITETHRVHPRAGSAIIRARKP